MQFEPEPVLRSIVSVQFAGELVGKVACAGNEPRDNYTEYAIKTDVGHIHVDDRMASVRLVVSAQEPRTNGSIVVDRNGNPWKLRVTPTPTGPNRERRAWNGNGRDEDWSRIAVELAPLTLIYTPEENE